MTHPLAKMLPAGIRGPAHMLRARAKWLLYHRHYRQNIVFIAALPKSGSTWLRDMFCGIPGFYGFQPHHVTPTDYNLQADTFRAYDRNLAVLHLHTYWTAQNEQFLKQSGLRYVIIYRDLRDAVVSWYFFISKNRSNHYLREAVASLSIEQGIHYYIDHFLASEVEWIRDWRVHRDPAMSVEITYERLRADTLGVFGAACRFVLGEVPTPLIEQAVARNAFERVSGRRPGQEDASSFARKGVSGDWRNHFTPEHKARFKELAGDLLIDLGYETDKNW